MFASNFIIASDIVSKAVTGAVASENRSKINAELSKIISLNIKEFLKVARFIACQPKV
ncbi:MAG: hypothetical protein O7C56_04815 [Rickettsia endosymbiont of Ixodes persulcatus]|nr:hypothetical protein [Rickettsia endosymbiont of Ixodes persulcatus]